MRRSAVALLSVVFVAAGCGGDDRRSRTSSSADEQERVVKDLKQRERFRAQALRGCRAMQRARRPFQRRLSDAAYDRALADLESTARTVLGDLRRVGHPPETKGADRFLAVLRANADAVAAVRTSVESGDSRLFNDALDRLERSDYELYKAGVDALVGPYCGA